jgi:predicted secreted protein
MSTFAIVFALAAAASTAPSPASPQEDPGNQRICKVYAKTGSLVQGRRVCRTKREWDAQIQLEREAAEKFIKNNRGRPGSDG